MTDIRRLLPLLLLALIPILSAYGLEITSAGTATDGANGFTELNGPRGVAVFDSGANTYAIVASYHDDGVQIIGITNPGNPTASGTATDGANGFTELNGPSAVAVFDSGANTYAIVASYNDNGVQIIDITDPGNPTASGTATDGANGFTELDGPSAVAVFDSGANTYAIVASYNDNGVQIIDITDPGNPTASGTATDGANGFTELDGPSAVAVFDSGANTYAIVASYHDDGVQIIGITDPGNPTASGTATDGANGFTELNGPSAVAVFDSGANTYAIVAGYNDDGVQIIDIADPGNPTASGTATDGANGFTELDGPRGVAVFDSGANTYAIVASYNDDGVQIIDIADPGNPTASGTATDGANGFTELDGPRGVAVFDSGANTYAIVASYIDDGVQIIRLGSTVPDTTPPVVTPPPDITAEATGPLTTVDVGTPTVTDADPNPTITHDAPESFPLGTTVVTWTATDSADNTATATQFVLVRDTTPPVVTPPPDITAEATGPLTTVDVGTPTVTDADPNPTITHDAPESFPLGTTVVTWTATDSADNTATATQFVLVRDTTPPVVTAPADVTADATETFTTVALGTATATDNFDTNPTITNDAPESFPPGETTVTWTATDTRGNAATATQRVTVRDTTPPTITAPPFVMAEATGPLTTVDIGTPTVTDADPNPTITNDAPRSFPIRVTVVIWTATDSADNTATATQFVLVRDTTPPVVTPTPDITAEATGPLTTVDVGTPTVTDADPNPTITHDAPELFLLGTTTVTWTATDSGGRTTTATQTVTVRDTTPPVVTPPPDITAEATGALTTLDVGAATATDNLDQNPTVTHDAPESFPPGETTVTWTATDSADNTATATQIVTVQYTYSEGLWYDHTREAGNQTDTVTLQAHRSGDFIVLQCLFFGQGTSVWSNQSTTFYEAKHNTTDTVHVRCYEKSNDIPAFQATSYAPYTPGSGFNTINEVFGSDGLFGVPIPFIFVLLVASMWTGRSAQVGIIVTAATIGIMTALGLFELQPEAWALIVLLTAAGVFLGKKLF